MEGRSKDSLPERVCRRGGGLGSRRPPSTSIAMFKFRGRMSGMSWGEKRRMRNEVKSESEERSVEDKLEGGGEPLDQAEAVALGLALPPLSSSLPATLHFHYTTLSRSSYPTEQDRSCSTRSDLASARFSSIYRHPLPHPLPSPPVCCLSN